MKSWKRIMAFVLAFCLMAALMPESARAAGIAPTPYAFSHAAMAKKMISVGGVYCSDAVVFDLNGPEAVSSNEAYAVFNFRALFGTVSFDAGYVSGDLKRADLTVWVDGQEIFWARDVGTCQRVTLTITKATQLIVCFRTDRDAAGKFAIGNINAVPLTNVPASQVCFSDDDWMEDLFLIENAQIREDDVSLGGQTYLDGCHMIMGGDNGTSRLSFNLDARYTKFSFDIGKWMNRPDEHDTRSAYLSVLINGVALPEYNQRELKWSDLTLRVELDVWAVTQLTIVVTSEGQDEVHWVLGNIRVEKDKSPEKTVVSSGMTPPLPFALYNAQTQTQNLAITSRNYAKAVLFTMENGTPAEITYNLRGLYSTVSFDAGYVDGIPQNAMLSVIADNAVLWEEQAVSCADVAANYVVNVTGVSKLTIRFRCDGAGLTRYGMGRIRASAEGGVTADRARNSDENINGYKVLAQNARVLGKKFSMAGRMYENGFVLSMSGDPSQKSCTAKLGFAFEGNEEGIAFDIAKFTTQTEDQSIRSAYLTISADGQVLEDYNERELLWNDIPLTVEIPLVGVSRVDIRLVSAGEEAVQWAIGDIRFGGVVVLKDMPTFFGNSEITPIHRLYNETTGEHFYTASKDEIMVLLNSGWEYEGVGWNAPTVQGTPVYRLFNGATNDHHYTMSIEERDLLVRGGWTYEGVCWNSATADKLPLYRLFNPNVNTGTHHYTASSEERDFLVENGWVYEGVGWYGLPG